MIDPELLAEIMTERMRGSLPWQTDAGVTVRVSPAGAALYIARLYAARLANKQKDPRTRDDHPHP